MCAEAVHTWSRHAATFFAHAVDLLSSEIIPAVQAYVAAAQRVTYILVSVPAGEAVSTGVLAVNLCAQVCIEGVEALGGYNPDGAAAVSMLKLFAELEAAVEEIIAPMPPAAAAAVRRNYEVSGYLLAAVVDTHRVDDAKLVLGMLADGLNRAVDICADRDDAEIGTAEWELGMEIWAETGST